MSSFGTNRRQSRKATRPTGTLTEKIQRQSRVSMRMPPRMGPTRVAMPAVAPHRAIAPPRRVAGKMRVITAMVCGVISEAPRPCTTRAATSPPSEPTRPQASEARVKMTSPVR